MPRSVPNGIRSQFVSRRSRIFRALVRVGVASTLVAVAAVGGMSISPNEGRVVQAAGESLGSGGEYHPVETPVRIFDSRVPALDVAPLGRKVSTSVAAGIPFEIQVVGVGGLPAFVDSGDPGTDDDNVLAVAVNVTVITPSREGWLRAFGTGAAEGESSVVNFAAGQVVPNTAILRPGANGKLSIRLFSPVPGDADVAIDLFGWFSTTAWGAPGGGRGSRLVPVGPGRIFDSRLPAFGATPLGAGSTTTIRIRGTSSVSPVNPEIVPNDDNVTGVMVNITGVNNLPTSKGTFVSAIPEALPSGQEPTTSNLNLYPSQVRANLTIVPVGADGAIRLFNLLGDVHLVVDVVAYLIAGRPVDSCDGRVVPLVVPFRAFDTRQPAFFNARLAPGKAEDWSFQDFVNDVKIGTEPVGPQVGLLGNLTATDLQRQYASVPVESFLTAFPTPEVATSTDVPTVSNLNIKEGSTIPNLALLKYGSNAAGPNRVRFYNPAGNIHYLLDVSAVILDVCAPA
jgi:hypothetical protein